MSDWQKIAFSSFAFCDEKGLDFGPGLELVKTEHFLDQGSQETGILYFEVLFLFIIFFELLRRKTAIVLERTSEIGQTVQDDSKRPDIVLAFVILIDL